MSRCREEWTTAIKPVANHLVRRGDGIPEFILRPTRYRFPPTSSRIALFILIPGFQVFEREIFVRRMRPAIGQGEAEEQRFHPQDVAELRDDRNASAFANERDLLR